ncbi:probable protein phosphatase CG10417 isoform X2 [Uranotaenia lowii]|uniref:probable protein phosphatase CG10417 isoform X2 n=1 Tax=Uranotaenia lowii TaxID=190385 RepID=UPI00247A9325|nr:probable protein phosphatase CG10417 isoform X2 [Uranotaenia lowii]
MGAYLSEPITSKESCDEDNDFLATGSSSMQGWRISQEDAHNCILTFDEKTSFFAVYDGHGGAEVAQYCSLYLPAFLKSLDNYKLKNFEKALKDAFIGFDGVLLEDKVIEELKKLNEKSNGEEAIEEDDDDEEEEDDNVDNLRKEAHMPLNEVLQMYKKDKKNPLNKLKEGSSSKPLSPYLKGKRKGMGLPPPEEYAGASSSGAGSSSQEADASSSKSKAADAIDSTVSSSSSNKSEGTEKPESTAAEQSDEISDTDGNVSAKTKKEECAPDSSSSKSGENESKVNGEGGSKSVVSSSSAAGSSAAENGIVSSGGSSNKDAGGSSSAAAGSSSANAPGGSNADSSSAGAGSSSSAASPKKRAARNGAPKVIDDSEDDDTETDEEFPPVAETSSTEDGEEDPEEGIEEEEDDEEGEYEEEEEDDYINEEDEAFMSNITDEPGKDSGCTAVVALLHEKELFVANAGDSRCVVCRNGKALEMSVDHKPEDQIEFDRIQKAGGRVTLDGRVNGGLNLSRAIGDHGYKMNKKLPPEEQMISALPDIKRISIGPEDDFMVLACDGIWNFMTSDDVVDFVQERIRDPTKKLSEICEEMFDYCLAPHTKGDGTGCDNMTAIIVQFKPKLTGSASRKRAASPDPESADCKKVKTSSTTCTTSTDDKSSKADAEPASSDATDEKEAEATVVSVESSSAAMDSSEDAASSST